MPAGTGLLRVPVPKGPAGPQDKVIPRRRTPQARNRTQTRPSEPERTAWMQAVWMLGGIAFEGLEGPAARDNVRGQRLRRHPQAQDCARRQP